MTDLEIGYKRIRAGVIKHENYSYIFDGSIEFNPYFLEHIQDAELMFQEMFQDHIISKIGDTGWGIWFIQFDQLTVTYLVDIYVDDLSHFAIIVGLINSQIHKDFNLKFSFRGPAADYK